MLRSDVICYVIVLESVRRSEGGKKNGMRGYNSDIIIVTTYQYYSMHRINQ